MQGSERSVPPGRRTPAASAPPAPEALSSSRRSPADAGVASPQGSGCADPPGDREQRGCVPAGFPRALPTCPLRAEKRTEVRFSLTRWPQSYPGRGDDVFHGLSVTSHRNPVGRTWPTSETEQLPRYLRSHCGWAMSSDPLRSPAALRLGPRGQDVRPPSPGLGVPVCAGRRPPLWSRPFSWSRCDAGGSQNVLFGQQQGPASKTNRTENVFVSGLVRCLWEFLVGF